MAEIGFDSVKSCFKKVRDETLLCNTCLGSAKADPVTMTCKKQHVFCFSCVFEYYKLRQIDVDILSCPTCREGNGSFIVQHMVRELGKELETLVDEETANQNAGCTDKKSDDFYMAVPDMKRRFPKMFEKDPGCIILVEQFAIYVNNFDVLAMLRDPSTNFTEEPVWYNELGNEVTRPRRGTASARRRGNAERAMSSSFRRTRPVSTLNEEENESETEGGEDVSNAEAAFNDYITAAVSMAQTMSSMDTNSANFSVPSFVVTSTESRNPRPRVNLSGPGPRNVALNTRTELRPQISTRLQNRQQGPHQQEQQDQDQQEQPRHNRPRRNTSHSNLALMNHWTALNVPYVFLVATVDHHVVNTSTYTNFANARSVIQNAEFGCIFCVRLTAPVPNTLDNIVVPLRLGGRAWASMYWPEDTVKYTEFLDTIRSYGQNNAGAIIYHVESLVTSICELPPSI